MDIGTLLNLVVTLVIVGLICGLLWWICQQLPAPFQMVGTVLIGLVAVIFLISLLTGGVPHAKFFH